MKKVLSILVLFVVALGTKAYDFSAVNADGKRIYYNVVSQATCEVTYGNDTPYSYYGIKYEGDISIPSTVRYNNATYSVTGIGEYAFVRCSGLASVTIPGSVTSIGNCAFNSCTGLTSFSIPNSVKSIGYSAFNSCRNLTSVTIGNSVESIGMQAFEACKSLTSIIIPNSVKTIDDGAFGWCTSLTSINLGNSIAGFGPSTLGSNTPALTTLVVASDNPYLCTEYNVLFNKNKTELLFCVAQKTGEYSIPNSVTTISEGAFLGTSITSVIIPNSVKTIYPRTFSTNLTSIVVDCDNPYFCAEDNVLFNKDKTELIFCIASKTGEYSIPNSVKAISEVAFLGTGITSVTIPNSVTSIGDFAFSNTGITSVTIPNSVTNISQNAFGGCSNLTSVIIPKSVKSIDNCAFIGTGITSITIPNSVTSIGDMAFGWCPELTSVTIGSSVTRISQSALAGCSKVNKIYINQKDPININSSDVFQDINKTSCTLYVPTGALDNYTGTAWGDFADIVEYDFGVDDNKEYLTIVKTDGTTLQIPLDEIESITPSISTGIKGDVNGDGVVNVSDAVNAIEIYLKGEK